MVPSRQSPLPGSKRLSPCLHDAGSEAWLPGTWTVQLWTTHFPIFLGFKGHKLPKLLGKKVNDLQSWVEVLRNPDCADCSQLFLQGLPPMDSGDRSPPTCQVSSAGHLRAGGGDYRVKKTCNFTNLSEIIVASPFPARSHLVSASCSATGNSWSASCTCHRTSRDVTGNGWWEMIEEILQTGNDFFGRYQIAWCNTVQNSSTCINMRYSGTNCVEITQRIRRSKPLASGLFYHR